ncbi:hypothetical protein [Methylobacterium radiotolerans]
MTASLAIGVCLIVLPTTAQAQRYRWLTEAQCRSMGGQWQPAGLAIGESRRDNNGPLVQPCDLGRVGGSSAPRTDGPAYGPSSISGGAGGRVAGGIAAGAAAIGILGQIAGAVANAGPSPGELANEAYFRQEAREKQALQAEAAQLNEQARGLAAAGGGRDEEAFRLFRLAWQTDNRGSGRNGLIYYRNMKMMRARIAYREALREFDAGKYTRAGLHFDQAASSAQEAQDEALSTKIKTQYAELFERAGTPSATQKARARRPVGSCTSINGELLCQ